MTDIRGVHSVAIEAGGFTLTRREATTVIGAVLTVASMALPWASSLTTTVNGFEYTWLSPGFVVAAAFAVLLAVPEPYSRLRYGLTALVGVSLTSIGVVFLLGLPSLGASAGIGLILFALGGLLVTIGGYGALIREMSTTTATAIVCGGSLAVLTVGIVLVQAT